ncbi:MAG: D-alanyl-D-alanine carboxypeptidase family protein [Clostridia bacterium]|nr:D-alanyl-D-alanine carboxypeptidase family protein [Clostridia bacterium]MBQ8382137.1 D-alanyl-D-alanine carboxypeptidase family protein [Clostridia bacterium]
MSNPRKRRKNGTPLAMLAAASVIALTVALVVLLIMVAAYYKAPDDEKVTSAGSKTEEPVTTVGTTQSDAPQTGTSDGSDKPVTPSETTAKTPDTTPAVPETTVPVTTEKIPETTPAPSLGVDYEYHIDMDKYEDYIDPTGDLWDDDYLILVNASKPISSGAENDSAALKDRSKIQNSKDYTFAENLNLNTVALQALTAMFLEAEAQGIDTLDVTSAYRSYSYQSTLFNNNCNKTYHWVCKDDSCNVDWIGKSSTCPICGTKTNITIDITREEQEANVATYSCAPGTSDHQTGLAVDIIQHSLPSRFDSLIQEFGETEAGKWLVANAHYFGFVLRFPEDKEEATGIIYEPWHFRYVGRTHAMAMYEMDLCLEEYVEYLNSIGNFN